jgi:hypothetical protein
MNGRILLLVGVLSLVPAAAGAQQHTRPFFASSSPPAVVPGSYAPPAAEADPALLAMGGVAGGAVGLVTGGFLGYALDSAIHGCGPHEEWCGFFGGLLGALAGEVAMIPYGVHLANDARGSYGKAFLASAAVLVGGFALGAMTDGQAGEFLVWAIPASQIAASVYVERRTAARSRP